MNFTFSFLVRVIVTLALGVTMLAIGLSRLDPPRPTWRTRVATRYLNLNEYFLNSGDRSPRWLDAESGRVIATPLQDGDVLEAASCAPWMDDRGRYQVAGRWSSRTSMGPLAISTDFGLARYTFPEGQLLDHVSTEIVPVGPPCWFPGLRARILFAGGDGELYHYAFEADPQARALDADARGDARPIRLAWRCPWPGPGKIFLSDLTWPEDPRLGGYVVVALREQSRRADAARGFTGTNLWWLKLDLAGTEVVEAGPLLEPDGSLGPDGTIDRRSPTVGVLFDGRPAVAYLSEPIGGTGWDLRVAPIELEGDHQAPKAREARGVRLATRCQPAHPSFSADGRWINAVAESSVPDGRILRLPLGRAFSRPR